MVTGYSPSDWSILVDEYAKVHLKQSALDTVLGRITASANLVDFRTNDKELFYILNTAPNANENAKDFRTKLLRTMILDGEALVVQLEDKWYVADEFTIDDKVLAERTYSNIFVDGLKLNKPFLSSEVYHFKYHNSKLSKLLKELDKSYVDLFSQLVSVQMRQGQLRVYAKFKGFNDPNKKDEE